MRLLLIEDEDLLARNISRALQRAGAEVQRAGNAATAREALAAGNYDLVIADISLGDGNGLDLLAEASPVLGQTPVIVMTGQDSVLNRSRAEGLSVAAFLSKPFALARLVELVTGLLRRDETRKSHRAIVSPGPSVVMYSHDTIGLGHMRRNSSIAKELVSQVPGISVLMLVGCPAGMVFEPHAGIDYVKTQKIWSDQGTDRLIADAYDDVLVYGDDSFFPSIAAYGLAMLKPGRVKECGIVTTARPYPRQTREKRPKRVLVSGGGGRDAFPMISAAIAAMTELPERKRPTMTVITGPLMDRELQIEAMHMGALHGVEIREHVPDLTALMAQSDLFITMTGYNSINEALAVGCPIVTVPRLGPSAEQRLRAEALDRAGLAHYLRREDLSAKSVAKLLRKPPKPAHGDWLNTNGVQNAARLLASFCSMPKPTEQERTHA